jgi:hypothetical protein
VANVKEETATYLKTGLLSQHLLGETEEYHEIPESGQWLKFELGTPAIEG